MTRRFDSCLRNSKKRKKILSSIIGTGLKIASSSSCKCSNSGWMLVLVIFLSILVSACSNNADNKSVDLNNNPESSSKSADTLQIALNRADSIVNCGELFHLETFEIGKIKNIFISVEKMTTKKDTICYVNIKKDCGNEYYYSWENKIILREEIKYYIEAIKEMQNNINRNVTHVERFGYSTKSGLNTLLFNENNGKGWIFAIKFRDGDNGTEFLKIKNIEDLKSLLNKCVVKINEVD